MMDITANVNRHFHDRKAQPLATRRSITVSNHFEGHRGQHGPEAARALSNL